MKIAKSVRGRPRAANVPPTSLDSSDVPAFFGAALSGVNADEPPAAGASADAGVGAGCGASAIFVTSRVAVAWFGGRQTVSLQAWYLRITPTDVAPGFSLALNGIWNVPSYTASGLPALK